MSSAEKPENYRPGQGQQIRRVQEEFYRTLPGRIRQMQEDKGKGIEQPEYPSKKAQEYKKQGKPVVFT
jgi:DNA replication initiation complex subunit (GINS family)